MGGKIGTNMRPRGRNAAKKKETVVSAKSPTVVGQQVEVLEPVLEAPEGDEKGSQMQAEEVQILDSSVAQSDQKDLDGLEAAMQEQSEPVSQGEKPEPPCGGIPMGKRPTIAELEDVLNSGREYEIEMQPDGSIRAEPKVGPQPDGSYKAVVTIPEGWWEPVTQWAQEAGVTPEQWLTDRLYEYISSYGLPAGKR